jgi:hypothetical protein
MGFQKDQMIKWEQELLLGQPEEFLFIKQLMSPLMLE